MRSLKDLIDGVKDEGIAVNLINKEKERKPKISSEFQIQTFIEPKFSKFLFAIITLKYLLIYGVLIIPLAYWILINNPYANNFKINIGGVDVQFNVILFTLLILYLLYAYLKEAMERSFIKYQP